jgi:hypothetical protein
MNNGQRSERFTDFGLKFIRRPFYPPLEGLSAVLFIRRSYGGLADWRTGGFTPPAQWNVIFPFIPSG